MSFTDEYLALRKKKKEKEVEQSTTGHSFTDEYNKLRIMSEPDEVDIAPVFQNKTAKLFAADRDDLFAPFTNVTVKATTKKDEEEDERKWFEKGAFEDGYQFGDVTKTILGTATDVAENVGAGIIGMGEKALDAFAYGSALLAQNQSHSTRFGNTFQSEEMQQYYKESAAAYKEKTKEFIQKDLYDEEAVAKKIVLGTDANSVLGEKSDALVQSGGQLLGTAALQMAGVPWFVTTGATSFGSQAEAALNEGATYEQAGLSAAISAGAEILTEKLSGGIKFGGKTLDDVLVKPFTEKIADKTLKTLVNLGVDAVGEGLEEVFSGVMSNLGTALYKEESIGELLTSEQAMDEYLESFIGGAVLGGIGSGVQSIQDSKRIRLSENEQKVVDFEVEKRTEGKTLTAKEQNKIRNEVVRDMLRGYLSTDTIEEVLGGETYQTYRDTIDSEDALHQEYEELGRKQNATLAEQTRYNELHQQIGELKTNSQRNALKEQLGSEVMGLVQNDRLAESYNERSRRGQAFEADLTKYDAKQQATIQKAIDSGILNNTNRTHEFVDMIAKITADKGVLFDFTNNEKLKDSGFAVDGKAVNGFVTKDGITLNIDSAKAMNSVVGHEVTHVLEGTELYDTLKQVVADYAKTKGDYQGRYDALAKLYEGIEGADIDAELTADLVGDYLFTDAEFVKNLSVTHRNVFQKIYDEIKYLYKVATAGSKEARELEKVKRVFEEAYKAGGKGQTDAAKYSMSDSDGKQLSKEQRDYFKDSKMRDENGNLKVMYHGSQDAGFHVFDSKFSDDETSFFFVDRNDVAASYSGTTETYEAKTIRTAEDMNNFLAEIGYDHYEAVEKNGKFELLENNEHVAWSDTAQGIYDEFCWYEGVGDGDANYKVYLNLTNPLVVDAEGRNWNNISREFSQEVYDRYQSLTAEEKAALTDLAEWGEYSVFKDEMLDARAVADNSPLASAYEKLGGANANLYDAFSIAQADFSEEALREFAVKQMNTRDYAQRAREQGYDGVIFKNIHDNGGYSNGDEGASTVAIAFDSNQIKSTANVKPTKDADIRYSLSNAETNNSYLDAVEHGDMDTARKIMEKVAKRRGYTIHAYHGTSRGDRVGNVFLSERATSGPMAFFTDSKEIAENYSKSKQDTSMAYDPDYDRYETQFRIKTKYNDVPLYRAWGYLPFDARNRITKKAGQLRENWDGDNELILDPDTNDANGGFRWQLKEARGNAIQALTEQWLNSGNLFNEEARFLDVLEMAGVTEEFKKIGMDSLYFKDPNAKHEKVYDTFLKIKKPFDTATVDEKFIADLEAWYDEQDHDKYVRENMESDMWDKNGIDAYDFAERLRSDLEHNTTHAWTSIPDAVTDYLKHLGHDGIKDTGGKFTGDGHTVWIPFASSQIKSAETVTYDDEGNVIPITDRFDKKEVDIRRSLSNVGEEANADSLRALKLEAAPVQEGTVSETETVAENATVEENLFPDDALAPIADDPARFDSLDDGDMPPEQEAPYAEDETIYVDDPFEDRDFYEVGKRNVKAYMYENPEVKPFFQEEALMLGSELADTIKAERWYNDDLYYESGGTKGFGGNKRYTSESIATLLDDWHMSYADIEKGINAIIEDNGAENIAAAKKIEFMLNDRLMNGYKNFYERGYVEPNAAYLDLIYEKQINEYSKEAFDRFMETADQYAPPVVEDIAPVAKPAAQSVAMKAPVAEKHEAIKPKRDTKQPRMAKATPAEQASAQVLTEEPKVDKKKPTAWNLFKDNVIDKGTVFETLSLKTGNRELQARWKSIGRAESSAQWFMEHGSAETSSLKSIRDTVEKSGKTQKFYEYLYHMHNVDRMNLEDRYDDVENKPVFGYGVTSDISKAEAAKLVKANPEFKQWAESVYSYMTNLREMMVDNGVISRETADLWAEMYPHYVPVRRKGDEGLNINVALDTKKTGVNAPVKRATGGNRDILPLFDTMAMRTEQTFKAIAKNRFGVELKNMLGTTLETDAVSVDEAIDSVESELLQEGKDGNNPTFTVFENGERVTFEITEEMYDTMKPKSKFNTYTNKALNKANDIRRGLLTEYNPAFMLTNPIKDTQDVLMNSQHPARTYANYPKAMAELLGRKGQYYQEYMEHGGEQNTYFDGETKTFKEKSDLRKVIGFPLDTISAVNNFIERIPRMAEYIASRKMGRSIDVSMLDAARVTTDFSAGGDFVKTLNRNGFTFLNASVQGAVQQVRNVREAKAEGLKGWAKLATKVAVAGLPSILLNELLWDDDEEYEELSDYVKQNYYIVAKYGDGKFVRIPKGRALAVIQNGFEQMQNLITGDDEADFDAFAELVISNLAPNNPLENNLIAPIMQAKNNTTWYGDDLVPTRLQDLPAAEQFDETTDSLSKWLGEKLNISPYKFNYVLDQYSGAIGDVFLPMMTQEAERGDNSLKGNLLAPIMDKFTTDSVLKNQNVSDFYDKKDELTVNANASGATDEDVLMSKYMNSVNSDLAKLYAAKRELQNSDLPDAEKYEAVRDIQQQIVDLTKEALQNYDDISFEDDYREGGEYARMNGKLYKLNEDGEWSKLSDEQVTKYEVTRAAGNANYASDGTNHYRWYVPGEDADKDAKPGWRKITEKELERQKEVTSGLGITPTQYWSKREEYAYAYDNPENYAVAKAVGGYDAYKVYSSELYDIHADKDQYGKSISGSRKSKVLDYINNLDADYYTKIILWKSEYTSDDSYNEEIIDYLNGRDDISFDETVWILRKLGFSVTDDGSISW